LCKHLHTALGRNVRAPCGRAAEHRIAFGMPLAMGGAMKLGLTFCLASLLLACGSNPPPSGNSAGSSVGSLSGTIDGKPFTPISGMAVLETGTVDLVFSSDADICGAVTSSKLGAGSTIVQIFGLPGVKPGTYSSDDTKVAVIDARCASGAAVSVSYSARASSATTSVTLTRVDAERVEGELSLTFEDGSSFAGKFSVAPCKLSVAEDPVCR
jgi:hypothetical protein